MKWKEDEDGDWFLEEDDFDACVCPHVPGKIKAAWNFGRWYKLFLTVEEAKEFVEKWWKAHPQGVNDPSHRETLSIEWCDE